MSNGVPADRNTDIPSFAYTEFTDGPSAFPLEASIERLLYVGRLSPEKGLGSLIEALAQVDTPVQLDIVGSGVEKAPLEEQLMHASFAHEVRFHGWVAYGDLEPYYRRANVFVHPRCGPSPSGGRCSRRCNLAANRS